MLRKVNRHISDSRSLCHGSNPCEAEWSSASGGFHPSKVPRTRTGNRLSSGYCRNLSAQHFAPFIETIDWNQASAFLESLPVRWCGIDGFNPGVYGLVRNLFIPSTMME